jgi:hypothetical protein
MQEKMTEEEKRLDKKVTVIMTWVIAIGSANHFRYYNLRLHMLIVT